LVPHTTWKNHTLASGLVMSTGTASDSNGTVNMHVLRVDLTKPAISVHPLMHSVAERLPLSTLAANKPRLLAATNTGYFDFISGAPTQPLIVGGSSLVMSSAHQSVVGLASKGRFQAGQVWLASGRRRE